MKEEVWNIKTSIGQVIELANKLNIKYASQERYIPNLQLSLVGIGNEIEESYQGDQKI